MAVAVEGFPPPEMPSRVMVRSYRAYPDAADAVDRLAREEDIPPGRVTVVARGLDWAASSIPLRESATGGAALGAVIGLALWAIGGTAEDVGPFLTMAFGAVLGVLAGLVVALVRHYTGDEPGRVDAAHYDVLVDEEVAANARDMLTR